MRVLYSQSMVLHAYPPSTSEVKARRPQIQGLLRLLSEILSPKESINNFLIFIIMSGHFLALRKTYGTI